MSRLLESHFMRTLALTLSVLALAAPAVAGTPRPDLAAPGTTVTFALLAGFALFAAGIALRRIAPRNEA